MTYTNALLFARLSSGMANGPEQEQAAGEIGRLTGERAELMAALEAIMGDDDAALITKARALLSKLRARRPSPNAAFIVEAVNSYARFIAHGGLAVDILGLVDRAEKAERELAAMTEYRRLNNEALGEANVRGNALYDRATAAEAALATARDEAYERAAKIAEGYDFEIADLIRRKLGISTAQAALDLQHFNHGYPAIRTPKTGGT